MYAIVEIAGQQFKVAKDQKVFVHRLKEEEGKKVTFNNVLLIGNDAAVTVGAPAIKGAAVEAKIVKHLKGDKVIVFKKKRRKGYRVKNGHRQYLTELLIEGIKASGAKVETAAKEAPVKADKKAAAAKEAVAPVEAPKKEAPKKEKAVKAAAEAIEDFSGMTVADLKAMAKEKGISGYSSMKKAELLKALTGK